MAQITNSNIFWISIALIFAGFTYLVSNILTPFLIAFIFAYILQPVITRYTRKYDKSRMYITKVVFAIFLGSFILISLILAPMIFKQTAVFIKKLPEYKTYILDNVTAFLDSIDQYDPSAVTRFKETIENGINSIFSVLAGFANHIWEYTLATINVVTIIALVPLILYYFLRDWQSMINSVNEVMPLNKKSKIHEIVDEINVLISAYIRGQLNICLILTVYYTIGLALIGLDLALLLGVLSGFLIIIPFIGAIGSFIFAALGCYLSFGFGIEFIYLILLYVIGHSIEGYILAPKIIGNKIGLHPLWVLFAVFAAGTVLGFWGIFFAIPIAGIVKVLLLHFIDYYKHSKYYTGKLK